MTEFWLARDDTDDGTPGEVTLYEGKPRWLQELMVFQRHPQGRSVSVLSEYRRKPYPIANGETARLVIDTSTIVSATSASTNGGSKPEPCVSVGTTG